MKHLSYVHGYAPDEQKRLDDQARTLIPILHAGTSFGAGSVVLEAGCGIGAQTVALARNNPDARFICTDISSDSLHLAQAAVQRAGVHNVTFLKSNLFQPGFPEDTFDHIFVCFVLEHLPLPQKALTVLRNLLRPGGTITVIEGDHGSTFFHPASNAAWKPIQCLVDLQAAMGGDALIGRRLYPLLRDAGFLNVTVEPKVIYADDSRPDMVTGFTWNTYIAMVAGARERAIRAGLISADEFDEGILALQKSGGPDGTFSYMFFKAVAQKSPASAAG